MRVQVEYGDDNGIVAMKIVDTLIKEEIISLDKQLHSEETGHGEIIQVGHININMSDKMGKFLLDGLAADVFKKELDRSNDLVVKLINDLHEANQKLKLLQLEGRA